MPEPVADARTRILRSALELVGSGGIAQLTNRNVARAADVSLGSLTYYFDSQAALLREALDLFISEEEARLGRLTDQLAQATLSVEDGVAALQALLGQDRERRVAKMELYLQATRVAEVREGALACFAAYDRLAAAALASLGVADAESAAPLVVAIVDGLQLRRLASGEAELKVAAPLELLLRAIRAEPAPRSAH